MLTIKTIVHFGKNDVDDEWSGATIMMKDLVWEGNNTRRPDLLVVMMMKFFQRKCYNGI